ncbi:uncharacterized protein LOC144617635 isoform X1 [Crassostrea virginica]
MNTEIRKSKVILTRRLAQQLKTDENETTLENFSNGANGHTEDCGISLKLKTDENETTLENFSNGANGHTEDCGISLKLKTDENETRLENFSNGANGHTEERGTNPEDEVDNLVGERVNTSADPSEAVDSFIGNGHTDDCGISSKLKTDENETTLENFSNGTNGHTEERRTSSRDSMIRLNMSVDSSEEVDSFIRNGHTEDCGISSKLKTDKNETTLENFSNGTNGHTEERGTSSRDSMVRLNMSVDSSEEVDSFIPNGHTEDCGISSKLKTDENETTLENFSNGTNEHTEERGTSSRDSMVRLNMSVDSSEEVDSFIPNGHTEDCGISSKLKTDENETTLENFSNGTNEHTEERGTSSRDSMVRLNMSVDSSEEVDSFIPNGHTEDCGISSKLKTDENETTLENFSNGTNGHTEERGTSSRDSMVRVNISVDSSEEVGSFTRNRSDDLKKPSNQFYPFSAIDFISINVSVVFFCLDFLTDILLAKDYYDEGMMFECALTSSLVAASFLVTGILSSFWHAQEKPRRNQCLIFLTFPFATIERNITYAFHGCKSKQKSSNENNHYTEMIKADRKASFLRMFDAFIESAPQLVLQIYLILKEQENMESCEDITVHHHILRLITVLSSWVSVSWSVTSCYRAIRVSNSMHTTQQRPLRAAVGYFMWRVFEIGPRIVALVLIILMNPTIFLLTVVFHYIAVVSWSFVSNPMPNKKLHEYFVIVLFLGFVQVFSFINTTFGKTRYHALIYYTFFYIENIVILILWIVLKKESFCPWIYHGAVGIVASGIIMNLVFIACYYKLCHPTTGIFKKKISNRILK